MILPVEGACSTPYQMTDIIRHRQLNNSPEQRFTSVIESTFTFTFSEVILYLRWKITRARTRSIKIIRMRSKRLGCTISKQSEKKNLFHSFHIYYS